MPPADPEGPAAASSTLAWRRATDDALRADIRRLGDELGRSLVRQVGPELLATVEEVRSAAGRAAAGDAAADEQLHAMLADVDAATATALARAFTTYFHLATVVEQTHRIELVGRREESERGWLPLTFDRLEAADVSADDVRGALDRLEVRPVVTAHPTEVSRRSVLTKLADIAQLVQRRRDPRASQADRDRIDGRTAELIDLLWVTDELRLAAPRPTDEAQAALYYVETLLWEALPDLLDDLRHELRSEEHTSELQSH